MLSVGSVIWFFSILGLIITIGPILHVLVGPFIFEIYVFVEKIIRNIIYPIIYLFIKLIIIPILIFCH